MRIRLQFGTTATFALAMIPLFGVIVGYLYLSNTELALETANRSMDQASHDIVESVNSMLEPVIRVVDATATLAKSDHEAFRSTDGLHFFYKQIETLPQVYSFYMGFESDNTFYQILRLPEGTRKFGPSNAPPPNGTRFALRLLDARQGERLDRYTYIASWGQETGRDQGAPSFDAKGRPWYKQASLSDKIVVSEVSLFSSTGLPGLTVSQQVRTDGGALIGVVGINLTLDNLASFLDRKKVGTNGRIFIIDNQGRLITQSHSAMAGKTAPGSKMVKAEAAADPLIAAAVTRRLAGAGDHFATTSNGQQFMAAFLPFSPIPNTEWLIGVIADEDEFTGDIVRSTMRVMMAGVVVLLVALVLIHMLSQQLTRPLRVIAAEAARIRDFHLDGTLTVPSRIIEVSDLANTISSMKTSLINFGAYVPKDLVRSIVSSGRQVTVGGERRQLTILFSDIQGFTQRSEGLPPEDVLNELSIYFRAISEAIHHNRGTIDKFIGDAVMALWNAPLNDENHAANACRALLACQRACETLNRDHADGKLMPMITRFGLHSGDVMVGNVGSDDRLQYTVLGAAVNLASRIEGLNKVYGTRLLVSETTAALAGDGFLFRPVDLVAPVGTVRPIALFELMGERGGNDGGDISLLERKLAAWMQCHARYLARDWSAAATAYRAYLAEFGDEELGRLYVERCEGFAAAPPPQDWNGVRAFDHK